MFTGIITHIGTVASIDKSGGDWRMFIRSTMDTKSIDIGASVCCSGACLTVVDRDKDWMAFNVSGETLSKTVIGDWAEGTRVNLERSLRLGDEIGGHLVSGHVDGLAILRESRREGDSHRLTIEVPAALSSYVASKGSACLDGISLTVNEVEGNLFGVNIIPHTWKYTTLGERKIGDRMNFEIDMLARYVARQLGKA